MRHAKVRSSSTPRGLTLLVLAILALTSATTGTYASFDQASSSDICSTIEDVQFDGTRANASVTWQVELGPRLPGSNASAELRTTITTDLESLGYVLCFLCRGRLPWSDARSEEDLEAARR